MVYSSPTVITYVRALLEMHVIIAPKAGVLNGNHMNDAVAEVNSSAAPNVTGLLH